MDGRTAPGVGPYHPHLGDSQILHFNYKAMPVLFALSLISFFGTKELWDSLEGSRMEKYLEGLAVLTMEDRKFLRTRVKFIARAIMYLPSSHNRLALQHWVCEVLNFAHVIAHAFFYHWVFDYHFLTYVCMSIFPETR